MMEVAASGSCGERSTAPTARTQAQETLALRHRHIGPNTALFFEDPCMVRGEGTYLYDDQGSEYLDCINNVAHVGHCHPEVRCPLRAC